MIENTAEKEEQLETPPQEGPGRVLRESRESRKLTLEAVAKQLHLDDAMVRALEDDDYSKFAAPIYIIGHLRAYARLLTLDSEPLVEMYRALGVSAPPPLERVAHLGEQTEPVTRAQAPRWLIYVLAVAVVVIVIVVWQSEATKLAGPVVTSPLDSDMQLEEGVLPGADLPLPAPMEGTLQSQVPLPAPAPAATIVAPVASVAPQSAPALNVPRASLMLSSEKPSWVEIKDSTGLRLFYDLMVPGDNHMLEGSPPFEVLLGFAPGIALEYNGKRVDYSAFTRQDMARFRVGDKGASRN